LSALAALAVEPLGAGLVGEPCVRAKVNAVPGRLETQDVADFGYVPVV